MMIDSTSVLLAHIQAGKIRALAVTSEKRIPQLPNLPTFAEAGYPQLTENLWTGLLAPAGTPTPIIQKLSSALGEALKTPEVEKAYQKLDVETKIVTPAALASFMARKLTNGRTSSPRQASRRNDVNVSAPRPRRWRLLRQPVGGDQPDLAGLAERLFRHRAGRRFRNTAIRAPSRRSRSGGRQPGRPWRQAPVRWLALATAMGNAMTPAATSAAAMT